MIFSTPEAITYLLLGTVVLLERPSQISSLVFSTFPLYQSLPLTITNAIEEGYVLTKSCESVNDTLGEVYSKPGHEFLPGLIYDTKGGLSGYAFGVNRTQLRNENETFAPFSYGNIRGQVYWFKDPETICDNRTSSNNEQLGIWIKMPSDTFFKLPERQNGYASVGYKTNGHWTEHLCLTGMGTHVQYGKCDSQYQFTSLYDAAGSLVGVVNAMNLKVKLEGAPSLIETVPSNMLVGLVFNETRFDSCYDLSLPRILVHVYLKKPEADYQSCGTNMRLTSNNNPTKRCALCGKATKGIIGNNCLKNFTSSCCCPMQKIYSKEGSCSAFNCNIPSSCNATDGYPWSSGQCNSSNNARKFGIDGHLVYWVIFIIILCL